MLIIIHGEKTAASRSYFLELKKKATQSVFFDGSTVSLTDLVQSLEGGGLFNEEQQVFIEELLSQPASNALDEMIAYLKKQTNATITFWEKKELPRKILTQFRNAEIRLFNPPKELFTFLDGLRPSSTESIKQFHQVLREEAAELIFFMMVRQFRLLIALFESNRETESIDEVKRLAPWQKQKLKRQGQFFSKDQLKTMYSQLFDIEYSIKTGKTPLTLSQAVDFFLLSL